jgi:hypothetical protein
MSIEMAPPPRVRPRRKYARAIEAIRSAPGAWVRLSLDEITGRTNAIKQTRIWQAADLRKIRVETTVQGGFMYVRTHREAATNA